MSLKTRKDLFNIQTKIRTKKIKKFQVLQNNRL